MIDFTKYNQLVEEWHDKSQQMQDELQENGFIDVLDKCRASNDYTEVNALFKDMEDSPCKAYVKRRIRHFEEDGIPYDVPTKKEKDEETE
jgi:hypothetical protein